jgi:ubiquinone biosynthesis protein UbiJ
MAEGRQPNPLLAALGRALEAVLNRALALDAQARAQVGALDGRRIGITLHGTPLALAIDVRDGRLRVGPHWQAPGDLELRAGPGSLLAFALRRGEGGGATPGRVEIAGDAELARRCERLLRDYAPDVEEAFARTFGDVTGVPLARALRGAFDWSRESAQAFARDGADFLRDETRDLVAAAELDAFLDDVDALRERVGRLAARIERLSARGGPA